MRRVQRLLERLRPEPRLAQWRACVEAKRRGLCKSIGVSNYGIAHIEEIVAAGLEIPAANQLEIHPTCQKRELLAYMAAKNIFPIAYSSLAPLANWREGEQRCGCLDERRGEQSVAVDMSRCPPETADEEPKVLHARRGKTHR